MIYTGDMFGVIKMIKHNMRETDKKQKDIVDYSGLTKGTVSNFLTGKSNNPTLDTLKLFCDAIGCDLVLDIKPRG